MTPRERAEALGWERTEWRGRPLWLFSGGIVYWCWSSETWVVDTRAMDDEFEDESDALAAALELRDVVLS